MEEHRLGSCDFHRPLKRRYGPERVTHALKQVAEHLEGPRGGRVATACLPANGDSFFKTLACGRLQGSPVFF
jgi:hypothetical protein